MEMWDMLDAKYVQCFCFCFFLLDCSYYSTVKLLCCNCPSLALNLSFSPKTNGSRSHLTFPGSVGQWPTGRFQEPSSCPWRGLSRSRNVPGHLGGRPQQKVLFVGDGDAGSTT